MPHQLMARFSREAEVFGELFQWRMQDPVIDAIHRRLDALEQTRPKQRACTEIGSRHPQKGCSRAVAGDHQSAPAEGRGCAPGFEWALHPAPPGSERCILVCETTPQFRQLAASLPSQADAVIEVNCCSPLLQ